MLDESILLRGERKLGEYQIAVIRRTAAGWSPTVPPLAAMVTNYRLILKPQIRRPYPAASIPSSYITAIANVDIDRRAGVKLCLKTGHQLHMLISWSQGTALADNLKTMLASPVGNQFARKPIENDLQRLIRFVGKL